MCTTCSLLIIVVVKFLFDFFCFICVEQSHSKFQSSKQSDVYYTNIFILISLLFSLVSLSLYINFLYITLSQSVCISILYIGIKQRRS